MMHTVILHGPFADFHDGPISVTGKTVAEVMERVTRQLPGFAPDPQHGRARIKIVGYETVEALYTSLEISVEIHVVPQLNGGKNAALTQIAIGVALIAVGWYMPTSWALLGNALMSMGAMSILGGLAMMLAPAPNAENPEAKSRYLGQPRNTVAIGTRIPIPYGRNKIYGHYISFDINAKTTAQG